MDDYTFLDGSLHVNKIKDKFDIDAEENAEVKDNLIISIDGTVMAVKTSVIEHHLADKNLKLIRMGWKKLPERPLDLKTADDLYKILTLYVPMVEEE